ncbi:hypothetical protein ASC95_18195 [Pelomonas sp. Root1217]|nr:hypothetical protein ASC95_18195 [Pelomonas sp. Root1217]
MSIRARRAGLPRSVEGLGLSQLQLAQVSGYFVERLQVVREQRMVLLSALAYVVFFLAFPVLVPLDYDTVEMGPVLRIMATWAGPVIGVVGIVALLLKEAKGRFMDRILVDLHLPAAAQSEVEAATRTAIRREWVRLGFALRPGRGVE